MIPPAYRLNLHHFSLILTVRRRCRVRFISFFLFLPFLVVNHDAGVAGHSEAEDDDEHDELGHHADVAGVGEGDDEADALPEAVVREGSLFVVGKEDAVEGCENRGEIIQDGPSGRGTQFFDINFKIPPQY